MSDWNLKNGQPVCLTLAADARLTELDYCNDQIWEVRLRAGEPAAVDVHTTYGLRARSMRLFPRFKEGEATLSDPRTFAQPPVVHRFFPNYLLLTYAPFPGIDVVGEVWVPESQAIAGRLRLVNNGVTPRRFRLEWVALLIPNQDGLRMTSNRLEGVTILQGQTEGLSPVVFMTGGPQAVNSPYPALAQDVELLPGLERALTWVQVAAPTPGESFTQARELASRRWEAEIARLELTNASQVEIHSGDPEWDAAFALGQKVALGLVHSPSRHLPHASFVLSRQPDQGYSLRGDGSDYGHLWNGQPALEAWYLARQILPAAPELAQGFLRNFLHLQRITGTADWKPGLAGQRGRLDATPLLANLAWEIYQLTGEKAFLEEVFPELLTFVLSWFSPYHDRDQDGIPEWDHPMQSGLEDHPTFSPWLEGSLGLDITTCESPALCAFLAKECQALADIAREIDRKEPLVPLQALLDNLGLAVKTAWSPDSALYAYWDRDSHRSSAAADLVNAQGDGVKHPRRDFDPAVRLLVHLHADQESTRTAEVTLYGVDPAGEKISEKLDMDRIRWHSERGVATSAGLFARLTTVRLEGLGPQARCQVLIADHLRPDITLALPLWAGIPDSKTARRLVKETLTNPVLFWQPFGLPSCPGGEGEPEGGICRNVWLPWNDLIGAGMLTYGYRREAATLVERLMAAVVQGLKDGRTFYGRYDARTGAGLGEGDALRGLPPLGLFLQVLGVRLLSPWKVALEGANPFPWPVEVKYKGLTVHRTASLTTITFPDGQSVEIQGSKTCLVER